MLSMKFFDKNLKINMKMHISFFYVHEEKISGEPFVEAH